MCLSSDPYVVHNALTANKETMQVVLKLLATLFILGPAFWLTAKVWRGSINVEGIPAYVREKFSPPSPLPLREDDAIYRGGEVVARVEGAEVDPTAGRVKFARVTSRTGITGDDPAPLVFRGYRVGTPASIETMTGTPQTGYVYEQVVMTILGPA
jgi:hypothetical protein